MLRCARSTLLVPLIAGLALARATDAQSYTVSVYWTVNANGFPVPNHPHEVLDPRVWAGFSPRLSMGVFANSQFNWSRMTVTQASGPAPLFGTFVITNGQPGCTLFGNSDCEDLPSNPEAGIYTARAVVMPGNRTGMVTLVVGGGAANPVPGPSAFYIMGTSDGTPYSYGLSLGDANPVAVPVPGLPFGAPASAFAADFANRINAGFSGPFTAVAAGDQLTIDSIGGGPFRFWIGDAGGTLRCQVTGGHCEFNPEISHSPPPPPSPQVSFGPPPLSGVATFVVSSTTGITVDLPSWAPVGLAGLAAWLKGGGAAATEPPVVLPNPSFPRTSPVGRPPAPCAAGSSCRGRVIGFGPARRRRRPRLGANP